MVRFRAPAWALVCFVAAALVTGSGGGADGTGVSRSSVRPQALAASADPWNAYETSVMPGEEIQPSSARVGLSLLGEPTNGFDGNLSAPGGVIVSWPSPAVLVTRDGARHWSGSLSAPGGFWDLDVLGAKRAWAVGVTGLYRTVNEGLAWQKLREPSEPLVGVAFADPRTGFGLTVKGRLVESRDSGSTWHASRWSGTGEALCALDPRVVIVADRTGGLWQSGDGGGTWRQVAHGFKRLNTFSAWYSDVSCDGSGSVEVSSAFCTATLGECGGATVLARVRQTTNRGRDWRVTITQSAGSPVQTLPPSALKLPLVRAAAMGTDGVCLVGVASHPPASVAIKCRPHVNEPFRSAAVPALPFPAKKSTVVVQGIDFLTPRVGWLLLDEYTAGSGPPDSRAKTEVWSTHDAGLTWQSSYASPTYHDAWCTIPQPSAKLHIYVCWPHPGL